MVEYIDPKMPPTTIFTKLYSNDLSTEGLAEKATFNKNELDTTYTHLTGIRNYERDLSLGNTLSNYNNWSHIESNSGYSIWGYPVTSFVDNSNNELYNNNIKLSYQGVATSSSVISGFSKVYISNSKRTSPTITDYTTEAGTLSGTPFTITTTTQVINETISGIITTKNLVYKNILNGTASVSNVSLTSGYYENSDYTINYTTGVITRLTTGNILSGANLAISYSAGSTLYVGYTSTYSNIYFKLGAKGVGNRISFDFSSGSNWYNFTPTLDSTNNFSSDGDISLGTLTGWTTATVSSSSGLYWTAIRLSQKAIGYPTSFYICRSNATATKLISMSPVDFTSNNYKWCYYNNKLYITIPNNGDTVNEGVTYIKSSSSDIQKQNYFIHNNNYITNYRKTASGVLTLLNGTLATTQALNDSSTKLATTAYVDTTVNLRSIIKKTANYTISASNYTILANTTSSSFTLTLPAASSCIGRVFVVKKITASNTVTLKGNGSQVIDNTNSQVISSQWASMMVQSIASGWVII